MRNFNKAKRILDAVTRSHPDFAVAHEVSGDLLFAQGYVGTAIKAYEQALRLDPTRAEALTKIEKAQQLIAEAQKADAPGEKESSDGRQMAFAEEMREAEQFAKSDDMRRAEDIQKQGKKGRDFSRPFLYLMWPDFQPVNCVADVHRQIDGADSYASGKVV